MNDKEVVRDTFWRHLDVVKLLNAFNIVFFMDNTYKTNKYRLPLFEIVGVTCTGLTFSAAFACMEVGREKTLCGHLKDMSRYGCIVRSTHGLPYAYELARYALGTIPHQAIHLYWTRLSFNDLGSTNLNEEFSVQQEFDVITKCLKEVDIANNITIKNKLCEIAFSDLTFTCPPVDKVKSKGSQKGHAGKFARSMKCHPSFFEHVDALRSQHDSSSSWKSPGTSSQQSAHKRKILMLDQFHGNLHPYISDIVDVGSDGHCGYRAVATLLSIGEDSWPLVYNDLHKEL
ncbi:hypothetical protein GmHk_14G040536 [Glycine max]|nr:hypothetical protein GmHk_14G040536 [Glycine max]